MRTATAKITPLSKASERQKFLYSFVELVKHSFNLPIPNLAVTMGFPSRRSRGKRTSRAVGEILVQEWKGDDIEQALLTIHPERFTSAESVGQSILLLVGDEVYGSRRHSGALTLGIQYNKDTADMSYTPDEKGHRAHTTLQSIIKTVGTLPEGHIELPEPRQAERKASYVKYACSICEKPFRGSVDLGKVTHAEDGGIFEIQVKKEKVVEAPAVTERPKRRAAEKREVQQSPPRAFQKAA